MHCDYSKVREKASIRTVFELKARDFSKFILELLLLVVKLIVSYLFCQKQKSMYMKSFVNLFVKLKTIEFRREYNKTT